MDNLGYEIKQWRFHHHIMVMDLACLIGVTSKSMIAIEEGRFKPEKSIIKKLETIIERSKLSKSDPEKRSTEINELNRKSNEFARHINLKYGDEYEAINDRESE